MSSTSQRPAGAVSRTALLLTALLLASCSAGGQGAMLTSALDSGALSVQLDPACLLWGASLGSLGMTTTPAGDGLVAEVRAGGARELQAVFCTVNYDAGRLAPESVEWAGAFGAAPTLRLAVLNDPGVVHLGEVVIHPRTQPGGAPRGLNGDCAVVRVRFQSRPATALRLASEVAAAPAARPTRLAWDSGSSTLTWGYGNTGDYDQNSLVNLADLTPLAVHFGENAASDYWDVAAVIDGDANGAVTLGDITPIAQHFGSLLNAFNIYSATDYTTAPDAPDDPSPGGPIATVYLADATGDPHAERLQFAHVLGGPAPDEYYWVRPDGAMLPGTGSEGERSNLAGGPDPTHLPTAALTADVVSGPAPLTVQFSGSGSTDPSGAIQIYEFDFNGDTVFDLSQTTPDPPPYTYSSVGTFNATLCVTDELGNTDKDTLTITVTGTSPGLTNLFFLHHSTGQGIIDGGVRQAVYDYDAANAANFEFWDHTYNADGLRDALGNAAGCYNIPNDNTDPEGLHYLWTSSNADAVDCRNLILANHDVIAFKSCFPASTIPDETELNWRKTWYTEMRDFFDANTDHLFVVMSTPPLHRLETNANDAANARAFADWLKSSAYLSGHANVVCFDLFNELAAPDDASATANMLRSDYEGDYATDGSHPNTLANQTVAPVFANFLCSAAASYP